MKEKIKIKLRNLLNESLNNIDYLYHGTSLKNAQNIIKYGLSDDTYWGDKNIALQYANSFNNPILIRLLKNEIINYLEPNTTLINFYENNIDYDEDYKLIIDEWENSEKTVNDSLRIFGSAILPPNNILIDKNNLIKI